MEQSLPISTGIIEIALKEKVRLARESPAYRRGFDNGAGKWFSRTLSLYHEFFIFAGELVWVKGTGPMRGYKKNRQECYLYSLYMVSRFLASALVFRSTVAFEVSGLRKPGVNNPTEFDASAIYQQNIILATLVLRRMSRYSLHLCICAAAQADG
jgi:hypothetical protein